MQSILAKIRLLASGSLLVICCTAQATDGFPEEGAIEPASPMAFEPVHLVLPTLAVNGYCHAIRFYPEFNEVERTNEGLRVRVRSYAMLAPHPLPGPCVRQWVRLGELPQGEYQVNLIIEGAHAGEAVYMFSVTAPAPGLLTTPAFDYSGLYWDPLESGSALQVTQTGRGKLGAVLLTYDEYGAQQWIVIGAGSWRWPGLYAGQAWRTRDGHPITSPPPDARIVAESDLVGSAIISFGAGIGIDPVSAHIRILDSDVVIIERRYQRFEY